MKNRIKNHPKSFLSSVSNAFKGIIYSFQTESHLRFHFFASLVVIVLSGFFNLTKIEWLFVIYAIGSVIVAELFNTALERVVDLAKPDFHPVAGMAKDVASGAVLMSSFQAVIIGMIIFLPYIF